MVYNDTSNSNGIIQLTESYTDLGSGYISGNTALLKQFTNFANKIGDDLWYTIWNTMSGWQWEDSNETDLPSATSGLTSGTARYALPSEALTINRVELKDESGSWIKLKPFLKEKENLSITSLESNSGVPTHYFLVGDTIQFYPTPNYTLASAFRVYFDRASVSFAYDDTTKTPGIASPFHGLYPLGMAITWLKIKQPQSPSLPVYIRDFEAQKLEMENFYLNRWKDNQPTLITTISQNFE